MKFNKTLATGVVMAVAASMMMPIIASADETPMSNLNVGEPSSKAEFNPLTVETPRMTTLDAAPNETVLVRLINNSSNNHIIFKATELQTQGNSFLVPAGTTREVVLPKAALGYETRRVDYSLEKIPDPVPPGPQFEDWKNRLAALVSLQRPDYSYFPQYQFNQ